MCIRDRVTQLMQASNQYAFKVDINSNKSDIKKAIESYFSVEVKNVTVIKVKGKLKRSKFRTKKKPDWKKAYVTLASGQSIDVGIE